MKFPTYEQYQAEKDPGRKLAMVVLVGNRHTGALDESPGSWPEELYTSSVLQKLARQCLEN